MALAALPDVDLVDVGASDAWSDVACVVVTATGRGRDADGTGCGPADLAGARRLLRRFESAPPAALIVVSSVLAGDRAMHSRVGRSRRALEVLVGAWADERGVDCTVVRPGVVVDPSPTGRRWLRRSVWNPRYVVEGEDPRRRFVRVEDVAARIAGHAIGWSVALDEFADLGSTSLERQCELVGRLVQPRLTHAAARRLVTLESVAGWSSTDRDVFADALVDLVDGSDPGAASGDPSSDLAWCDGSSEAWWSAKNAHERQMVALAVGGVGLVMSVLAAAALFRRLSDPSAG